MEKKIFTLFLILFFISSLAFAETVVLKSGKTVEGKIIEKTDKYIVIEIQGVPLTYFFDDIDNIKTDIPKMQETIENSESIAFFDMFKAVSDPDAEQKIINAIKADPTMSEEKKQEALINFKQMLTEQRKLIDKARTEDGKIDIDKLENITFEGRVKANDLSAKAAIQLISTAIETYRAVNDGKYPDKEEVLLNSNPPYLSQSYNKKDLQGYIFSLELRPDGYKIIATPEECGKTGNKIFIANSLKDIPIDWKDKTAEEQQNLLKASMERKPFELMEKDCEKFQ